MVQLFTIEFGEWISNLIPHIMMHVITYPWCN